MNTVSYQIKNCQNRILRISSKNGIDFTRQCTQVDIYRSSSKALIASDFGELIIYHNRQSQTTMFDIPIKENDLILELTAVTKYNIEEVTAQII